MEAEAAGGLVAEALAAADRVPVDVGAAAVVVVAGARVRGHTDEITLEITEEP